MAGAIRTTEIEFGATDGVPLAGTLVEPAGPVTRPAVVLAHGVGGNRQGRGMIDWSEGLAARGFPAMPIDTRGHDWNWSHGATTYGAGHERLAEAPRDLAGAVAALRARGHERVILAGQSLGTVKVAHALATEPIEGVVGAVLRSGPRFSDETLHERFGDAFARTVELARARVAAEGPAAMIDVEVPLPGRYAAGAYLEKYVSRGQFDWLAHLENIAVPRLILLGGADPLPLVIAAREAVQAWPSPPPGCEVHVVPGADHGFSGHGDLAAELVARWWDERAGRAG